MKIKNILPQLIGEIIRSDKREDKLFLVKHGVNLECLINEANPNYLNHAFSAALKIGIDKQLADSLAKNPSVAKIIKTSLARNNYSLNILKNDTDEFVREQAILSLLKSGEVSYDEFNELYLNDINHFHTNFAKERPDIYIDSENELIRNIALNHGLKKGIFTDNFISNKIENGSATEIGIIIENGIFLREIIEGGRFKNDAIEKGIEIGMFSDEEILEIYENNSKNSDIAYILALNGCCLSKILKESTSISLLAVALDSALEKEPEIISDELIKEMKEENDCECNIVFAKHGKFYEEFLDEESSDVFEFAIDAALNLEPKKLSPKILEIFIETDCELITKAITTRFSRIRGVMPEHITLKIEECRYGDNSFDILHDAAKADCGLIKGHQLVEALKEYPDTEQLNKIIDLCQISNDVEMRLAASAINIYHPGLLRDVDPMVRRCAEISFQNVGLDPEEHFEALQELTKSESWMDRKIAVLLDMDVSSMSDESHPAVKLSLARKGHFLELLVNDDNQKIARVALDKAAEEKPEMTFISSNNFSMN